jgi:hypothetical protein
MPAYGLIPDSPVFYYAGKIKRYAGGGGASRSYTPILRNFNSTFSVKFKNLKIYDWALNLELHSPSGALWKSLAVKSKMALYGARAQAGVKTGALKASIYQTHRATSYGQEITIGSRMSYALMHHEGTRPHYIKPKQDGGYLVFRSKARIVRTTIVLHPGTRPNPYLKAQLRHFRY